MTELPEGWKWFRLDEVAEVRLGRQRSPKNHTGTQMRPYLRAANVDWGGLALEDVKEMNFTDEEMAVYRLERGDILLSEASGSAGEVGKPALWNGEIEDCAFQNTLLRVRSLGPDPRYIFQFFSHLAVSGAFAAESRGVGIHHIGKAKLAGWMIPLPPPDEQRRIVSILEDLLSRVAAGSTLIERSVFRAWALRNTLLSEAFMGGRGPEWRSMTLGDVAHWGSGGTPKAGTTGFYGGDIPWAVIGDLTDGPVFETASSITPRGLAESSAKIVPEGSVLVAMYGSIGKLGLPEIPMATNQAIAFAVPRSGLVERKFLFWYLMSQRVPLTRAGKGGTQQNISQTILKGWPIDVPPLDEQKRIVDLLEGRLNAIDECRSSVRRSRALASSLRKSLLAAAFAGRLGKDSHG